MSQVHRRAAFALFETLLASCFSGGLLAVLLMTYGLVSRGERSVSAAAGAVASAELAADFLRSDLRAMLPPDPTRIEAPYRIGTGGRDVTLIRVVPDGDALVAKPVQYEARETGTGRGNLHLYRNGRRMGGIVLRELVVTEERSHDGDPLFRNPRIRLRVVGIDGDRVPSEARPAELHAIEVVVPVPATSPAAMAGLPPTARVLLGRAVRREAASK